MPPFEYSNGHIDGHKLAQTRFHGHSFETKGIVPMPVRLSCIWLVRCSCGDSHWIASFGVVKSGLTALVRIIIA